MAKLIVLNPEAQEPAAAQETNALPSLRETRVGVLRNQKQHAGLVMTRIAEELSKSHGVIINIEAERPTSGPADPALLDRIAENADWVITGSAD